MEIVLLVLVLVAVPIVVLGAKRGADAAQREREQRWGGFSSGLTAGVPPARGGAPPPLAPRDPGGAPPGSSAPGAASRPVLRAFRRPRTPQDSAGGGEGGASEPTPPEGGRQAVAVTARPPRRAATASRTEEAARRAAGSAAQNATGAARAVRSSASAALRLQPAPVDINRAPVGDLQKLPGVGIRAAERIVAHRERHGDFASVEDLTAVEGFDQHRVSRLAPRATV